MELTGYRGDIPAYDTYGDIEGKTNTKWSVILAFNAVVYLLNAIFTAMMCMGPFLEKIGVIGVLLQAGGCCTAMACLITTGVFRYSSGG